MASRSQKIRPQHQDRQPGLEEIMSPEPQDRMKYYKPAGKLKDKVALISGGDSGIGRAIAIGFAKEGANVAIIYLDEDNDAQTTRELVEQGGKRCVLIAGDVADPAFCEEAVEATINEFGKLNILVNNAGEQHQQEDFENITHEQLKRTFDTNVFSQFYLTKSALKYLKEGACIINTASITAYKGNMGLIDYSATKGAIVSFTRSLSQSLLKKNIRVNAVAPGPIWTPLIPASYDEKKVAKFGTNTPMGRPGQPDEVAPCYIFLASEDSSYMAGQVLHPNGGTIVNG